MSDNDRDLIKVAENGKMFRSWKTYGHDIGLSVAFRQWRAQSHCRYIHGYAIKVHLEFQGDILDERNWIVDFGSLKSLKGWLEDTFDHKLLVAIDDPKISIFRELHIAGLCNLREVPATGCEAMARMIYEYADQWLKDNGYTQVILHHVDVHEHGANGARYGYDD